MLPFYQGLEARGKISSFLPCLKAKMLQGVKNCKTRTKFIIRDAAQCIWEHTEEHLFLSEAAQKYTLGEELEHSKVI